jgi:sulfite reductase (NADPH) hemoprotein beta-component
VYSLFSTKGAQ